MSPKIQFRIRSIRHYNLQCPSLLSTHSATISVLKATWSWEFPITVQKFKKKRIISSLSILQKPCIILTRSPGSLVWSLITPENWKDWSKRHGFSCVERKVKSGKFKLGFFFNCALQNFARFGINFEQCVIYISTLQNRKSFQ